MTFSKMQLKWLRDQGIEIIEPMASGSVKCSTPEGERYFTSSDLQQLAKPGFFDRFTAFMGVRHASN
jgi:hypothetical protein